MALTLINALINSQKCLSPTVIRTHASKKSKFALNVPNARKVTVKNRNTPQVGIVIHFASAGQCFQNTVCCKSGKPERLQAASWTKNVNEASRAPDAHHDPVTSELPVEIVSSIFHPLLQGCADDSRNRRTHNIDTENNWYPLIIIPAYQDDRPVGNPMHLASVCCRWRNLTYSLPVHRAP